jgi:catechol 2,3-dioxygenase
MNGIEFYADRPKNLWPDWSKMQGGDGYRRFAALNKPLDLDSLVGELGRDERAAPTPFPRGAKIGHMHLRVTNLERSVDFYHGRLGLDIMSYMPEIGAAFLSVGGYHHHLGLNTWHSHDGSPRNSGDAGLDEFKILIENKEGFDRVASRFPGSYDEGKLSLVDPDGIRIVIQS